MTPALLRPQAEVDLIARTRYYQIEGGDQLGERFFDAAVASLGAITRMPRAGSPRLGELCGIPGLRVRRIDGFPCSWFYFDTGRDVDVVRLLADAQDLPTLLGDLVQE